MILMMNCKRRGRGRGTSSAAWDFKWELYLIG